MNPIAHEDLNRGTVETDENFMTERGLVRDTASPDVKAKQAKHDLSAVKEAELPQEGEDNRA